VGIRRRLALLGALLATGTVVLFAGLLVLLVVLAAPANQDRALDALARQAAMDYRPGGDGPAVRFDAADSLDPFVVVTRPDGRVLYSGATVAGEVPDVPAGLVQAVIEEGAARTTADVAGVELRMSARPSADGQQVVIAAQPVEFRSDQAGGLIAVLVIAAVLTAIAGAVASWVVSGRALRPVRELAHTARDVARTGDVTRRLPAPVARDEVAALTSEFNAMMDRLQGSQAWLAASLDQQRRFLADASHELRTPLATIRSNAGFLADRPEAAAADRAEAIRDLKDEADRMSALVEDLLVLARSDGGPVPVRRSVDLVGLVADVCRIEGTGALPGRSGTSGAVVLGDEAMLRRMIRCLLVNGRLHGGGRVWARVDCVPGWVTVTVWDAGPGFPPQALPRVFDRFYRADPARSGRGTGLGLAIAQSVARVHGGGIHAGNGPGGGAVVTVHLPATD
jgi:signal transduction histidine kinase